MKGIPRYTAAIIIFLLFTANLCCKEKINSSSVRWESFNEGMSKAKKENKPVFIDFYADWCYWCKVMDRETFADEKIIGILNRDFISVRLDMEKNEPITYAGMSLDTNRFASALGVKGLPSSAFLDENGNLIDIIPGYIKTKMFDGILRYIMEGCYKMQVSFKDYIDKKADCN